MTEMSPQEAAAVWIRVPEVEQELTPRVVGLSNILTGLAIAVLAIPLRLLVPPVLAVPVSLLGTIGLVLLFLALRAGLWRVYGLAKPEGRTLLYRYRTPGSWKWMTVDWWYLAVFVWGLVGMWWADGPVGRSAAMIPLFLTVYALAGGAWERRQPWSRRPYLLLSTLLLGAVGWALHVAGVPGMDFGLNAFLGLAWIVAGTALYHQA